MSDARQATTMTQASDALRFRSFIVQIDKAPWQRPAFTFTGTGFEVTMYLGTQGGAK
ncbi:MAG: hypothetical protein NVS3B17_22860 [Vulcanimicrobiaceae bacterium]